MPPTDPKASPIVIEQLQLHAVQLFTEAFRALGILTPFSSEAAAEVLAGVKAALARHRGN